MTSAVQGGLARAATVFALQSTEEPPRPVSSSASGSVPKARGRWCRGRSSRNAGSKLAAGLCGRSALARMHRGRPSAAKTDAQGTGLPASLTPRWPVAAPAGAYMEHAYRSSPRRSDAVPEGAMQSRGDLVGVDGPWGPHLFGNR